MGFESRTIAHAEHIATKKEAGELDHLVGRMERAKDPSKISPTVDQEVKRLKPQGTFDHEEVMIATNVYTNGRKDGSKVRLSQIKSEEWAKTGK